MVSQTHRQISQLKPCPFCQAYAFFVRYEDEWCYAIKCVDCGVQTEMCPDKDQAIKIWNRRVIIDGNTKPRDPFLEKAQKEAIDALKRPHHNPSNDFDWKKAPDTKKQKADLRKSRKSKRDPFV